MGLSERQLISSERRLHLLGWAEMLKNISPQTEDRKEITGEIDNDL
ncbi:MAG: hypothetical protein IPL16_01165 [Ignavibacteria bacterium]|nr:hypothetical protein [Ignavibacteria bacterium]